MTQATAEDTARVTVQWPDRLQQVCSPALRRCPSRPSNLPLTPPSHHTMAPEPRACPGPRPACVLGCRSRGARELARRPSTPTEPRGTVGGLPWALLGLCPAEGSSERSSEQRRRDSVAGARTQASRATAREEDQGSGTQKRCSQCSLFYFFTFLVLGIEPRGA